MPLLDREESRLVAKTLMITPSGALSPGPLSMSAVAVGAHMGFVGGLLVAAGHTAFELPYVLALVRWANAVERVLKRFEKLLNGLVVAFIAYFSASLAAEALSPQSDHAAPLSATSPAEAFVVGLVLTGANAYFLAWWLTVAMPLVRDSARLGLRGFTAMYASHVWLDYVWLALLAGCGGAAALLGREAYSALLLVLAIVLALFGADLALRTYAGRRLLPL